MPQAIHASHDAFHELNPRKGTETPVGLLIARQFFLLSTNLIPVRGLKHVICNCQVSATVC